MLDYLINNAGALVAPRREVLNYEGVPIELMLQVNHLAPFVLSLKLLPLLRKLSYHAVIADGVDSLQENPRWNMVDVSSQ